MTGWMKEHWTALACVVIFLCALVGAFFRGAAYGAKVAGDEYKLTIAKINEEHISQLAIAIDAARKVEQAKIKDQAAIANQLHKELKDEIDSRDRLISDLRAGTVQLRKRFTCPAGASGDVPSATTSPTGGDAVQAGGLQTADAEFLISIADEADQVARQLAACQALVRLDRE